MKIEFRRSGDFWIDLGIATLFEELRLHGKPIKKTDSIIVENVFKTEASVILESDALLIEGEEIEVKKVFDKINITFRQKACGGKTKKGKEWFTRPAEFFFNPPLGRKDFDRIFVYNLREKEITCDVCGQTAPRAPKVGSLELPLIVATEKMQTFYSAHRGKINLCASCALAGRIAPFGLVYSYSENKLNFFLLDTGDLVSLAKGLHSISRMLIEQSFGNYKHFIFPYPQYPAEAFIDFLFNCWSNARAGEIFSEQMIGKRFHILQGNKKNKVVTFQRFYTVPEPERIFGLISRSEWKDKHGKIHNSFKQLLNFMAKRYPDGKANDTTLREELCRRILENVEIIDLIEGFVYDKFSRKEEIGNYNAINIRRFVETYKVMDMEEKMISNARRIGEFLGRLAVEVDNSSILYSIRSARNIDQLLSSFQQIFIRYYSRISVTKYDIDVLLSSIDERNFTTYKSLIGLYAVLNYVSAKEVKK
ncbi:MAG: hypothetical protein QXT45_02720 [Candidatus Bilamarchaeaceae archaeon]